MKYKESALVVDARKEGPYYWLALQSEKIASESKPGQFINIRVSEGYDPLLRRPFSIGDVENDVIWILFHPVGKGTRILAQKRPGDSVNIIGPLGKSFPDPTPGRDALYVAGGIGIAPFLLMSHQRKSGILLYGARNHNMLPDIKHWEKYCPCHIATDDGSRGIKGNVIDLLKKFDLSKHEIFACGPTPMFKAMSSYFETQQDIKAWYSLETYMGCGFGACKGCSVEQPDTQEMKLCCVDGPVFEWNKVKL